jgi:predicted sulfurtransferase
MTDYDEWDMKIAEWRGHVLASMEGLNKEISQLREDIKENTEVTNKLNSRLTGIEIKVATIGGVSGIITSLVLWILTRI